MSQKSSAIRRFIPYFKPYWRIMALDLFCASMTTLCELVLPLIVRTITNRAMTDLESLTTALVLRLGFLYIFLRLVDVAANYYMQSIGHIMGSRIETDMRRDIFAHLQKLSFSYYDNAKVGQIMARITSDLFDVTEFAHHCPEEFFIAFIKIAGSFSILCTMNVGLTLLIFAMIPLMVLGTLYFSRKMHEAFKESRHLLGELNAKVEDSLLGVRVVRSFANEPVEEEHFREGNHAFLGIKKKQYHYMAGFGSVTRFFNGLLYIVVVVVGALCIIRGSLTAADLVAYLLYVTTLLNSVTTIVNFSEQFQRGITGVERFYEIMDEPVTICDKPGAKDLPPVKGEVEFRDVTFRYNEGGDVLHRVSLKVPAGESVALVGPSGGGKTTLCSLIPRFYEVTGGSITIDGFDIRDVTTRSLRSQIGVVQQDVYLFSGSVRDNIEYGKPGASDEEIIRAAKMAGADEFIRELPQGYDTFVGERGVKLSGGQKQRISIARVFLKNPPVLILDEATSALDNESELLVQKSLEKLAQGRTTFTIAHRLTTIRSAHTILVLTSEGIVEQGNHAELMAKKGLYYSLYRMYAEPKAD